MAAHVGGKGYIIENAIDKGKEGAGQYTSTKDGSSKEKPVKESGNDGGSVSFDSFPSYSDQEIDDIFNAIISFKKEKTQKEISKQQQDLINEFGDVAKTQDLSLPQWKKVKAIKHIHPDLDFSKIMNLSDGEIQKIYDAFDIIEKTDNAITISQANAKNSEDYGIQGAGIWNKAVHISDYPSLESSGSIELKRKYFESAINSGINVEQNQNKLEKLNEYIKLGKEYEQSLKDSPLYSEAKSLIEKYQDIYSWNSDYRKNNAFWAKSKEESLKKLEDFQDLVWKKLTSKERQSMIQYTSAYSSVNEPLRGVKYSGYKGEFEDFKSRVFEMTNAIDKSPSPFDMWVQRGTTEISINGKHLTDMSKDDLSNLVGQSFYQNSFYSAGAAKGTGFDAKQILINTYCPKGTKMLYIAPHSEYEPENEIILQRGYQYKISKVEKKGAKIFLDVDVVPNSDSTKEMNLEKFKENF